MREVTMIYTRQAFRPTPFQRADFLIKRAGNDLDAALLLAREERNRRLEDANTEGVRHATTVVEIIERRRAGISDLDRRQKRFKIVEPGRAIRYTRSRTPKFKPIEQEHRPAEKRDNRNLPLAFLRGLPITLQIVRDTTHIVTDISYRDNTKRFVFSKTPSDYRTSMNERARIKRWIHECDLKECDSPSPSW